jgi:hypothetical protein
MTILAFCQSPRCSTDQLAGLKCVALAGFAVNDIDFERISSWIEHENIHSTGLNLRVSSICCHCHVELAIGLTAKRSFENCQLGLDISLGVPTLDDVFAIAAEEVMSPSRFIRLEISHFSGS